MPRTESAGQRPRVRAPARPGCHTRRMGFLIRSIVNGFAIWVISLIPFLQITVTPFSPGDDLQLVVTLLAIGALFGLVNTIIGTIIKIVAFPLRSEERRVGKACSQQWA